MSISHSRHCVDLEVFVRTDTGDGLDGSPVGPTGLSIVEPLLAQMLHVVSVNVGNAVSDLRSMDTAADRKQLGTDFLVDSLVGLSCQERIPEVGTTTDDFDVVEIVTVDGGEASTAIVHLAGEDFISEEVVTKETVIGVGEVVRISHSNIRKVTEESMHRIVLLFDIIDVLGVLVDSV